MPMNSGRDYKARETDIAQPLMAGGPVGGNQGGDFVVQARTVALRGRDEGGAIELGGEQANALRASSGGGDKPYVLAPMAFVQNTRDEVRLMNGDGSIVGALSAHLGMKQQAYIAAPAIAFSSKDYGADAGEELAPTLRAMGHDGSHANAGEQVAVCITGQITHTLKAEGFDASEDGTGRGQPIVASTLTAQYGKNGGIPAGKDCMPQNLIETPMAVRRLMPVECERLQGFPDGYTDVPVGKKQAADGPRYKQLGNSWAVPCVTWIGRRIQAEVDRLNALPAAPTPVTENRDSDFDLTLVLWALAA